MSFEILTEKIREMGNPTVAGLDPSPEKLPGFLWQEAREALGDTLEAAAQAAYAFNRGLIDALCDIVPAVKPQSAYYERLGWPGVRALKQTIDYAKSKGMYVIVDAKRNDIGSTMEAYAQAYLGEVRLGGRAIEPFGADALTVNGYLGTDGIAPLIHLCKTRGKAVFVLVKTSNPSSGELQDRLIGESPVYEHLGRLCETWSGAPGASGYGCAGAVVGATYPRQLRELRRLLPHTFFLVPGYGAQGGGAGDVAGAFDQNGGGAIVNSSRAIMYAWKKEDCQEKEYAQAARREALRMRDEITGFLTARKDTE